MENFQHALGHQGFQTCICTCLTLHIRYHLWQQILFERLTYEFETKIVFKCLYNLSGFKSIFMIISLYKIRYLIIILPAGSGHMGYISIEVD